MVFAFLVLLVLVPIMELAVLAQVSTAIGFVPAVGLLVLLSIGGLWLMTREGLGVVRRMQTQLSRGELPTDELVDGVVLLVAGGLLLFPGYVTDAVALMLLIPPVRAGVRTLLVRRYRRRLDGLDSSGTAFGGTGFGPGSGRVGGAVYDVTVINVGDVTPPGYRRDAGDDRGPHVPPPAIERG